MAINHNHFQPVSRESLGGNIFEQQRQELFFVQSRDYDGKEGSHIAIIT